MEALPPVVVIDGRQLTPGELAVLGRHLAEAIRAGYTVRRAPAPRDLLDLAVAVNRWAAAGTRGTGRRGGGAGQGQGAEPRNTRPRPDSGASGQPATLSVKEAAQATEVSESYLRRLVRDEVLEVRDGERPGYEIYADSLAAWQERRRRKEANPEAA